MTKREILNFLPPSVFRWATRRRRDALFIWVPKCAGTSIYKVLVDYGCQEELWLEPGRPFSNRGVSTFGHVSLAELMARGKVSRDYVARAYKFGFVRNPFDRLVSLYHYLRNRRNPEVPESMSFTDFCRCLERGGIPPVGFYNERGLSQCNPMVDWLVDGEGNLLVDFLGRHETLAADFQAICQELGIPAVLPHENRTQHGPYQEYYTGESRGIVERLYRRDLERFGYGF